MQLFKAYWKIRNVEISERGGHARSSSLRRKYFRKGLGQITECFSNASFVILHITYST